MSLDISHILADWDFDRHELTVRTITGADGRPKIQLRTDLGLMQMNLDGRPDGQRPMGHESYLEYFRRQAADYGDGYRLNGETLHELFHEGWQYYQRYLCGFQLGMFELVIRDTSRNLGLTEFVADHCKRPRESWRFDQYRPYLLMMRTRARAQLSLQEDDVAGAVWHIDTGRELIRSFLEDHHLADSPAGCFELEFLTRWRGELATAAAVRIDHPSEPIDPSPPLPDEISELQNALHQAIAHEQYERAAQLRDQLRLLEQRP